MTIPTPLQQYAIAGAIYSGILIGIAYSILGILRAAFHNSKLLINLIDSVFICVAFVLTIVMLLIVCDGIFIPFLIACEAVTALIWILFPHRTLSGLFARLRSKEKAQ